MKVVDMKSGKKETLTKLPKPPVYLNASAKKHFRRIGKKLMDVEILKKHHLPALEIIAVNYAQWEWALREISKKNKNKAGSGYKQKYQSGAENISVELTIKRDAEKLIMQSFKQFGLDPKSEKDLKQVENPNQTSLFHEFKKMKSS